MLSKKHSHFIGLPNLSGLRDIHAQTCYLNACLQCLAHCHLGEVISKVHIDHDIESAFPLVHHVSVTVAALRTMTVDTWIECLWHSLQRAAPLLFKGSQQDVWDAFHFLVERIDECLVNLGQTSLHSLFSTSYVKEGCAVADVLVAPVRVMHSISSTWLMLLLRMTVYV